MKLEIIHRTDRMIAINKPHGLLVHRSSIARDAKHAALQLLRDQIAQRVYPVHRLDRKTGGVLLFALDREMQALLSSMFMESKIKKEYLAIVRGYTAEKETIDYALKNEQGKTQKAVTRYHRLAQTEIPYALGKYASQRYSLVCIQPETGRMHQIRKHFSHIFHPVIGDSSHGCNKQNRFFKHQFSLATMMLHARRLSFQHPERMEEVVIEAQIHAEFERMIRLLGFQKTLF